jgi:hypothetical protein
VEWKFESTTPSLGHLTNPEKDENHLSRVHCKDTARPPAISSLRFFIRGKMRQGKLATLQAGT